jgi:hypothetical protein
LSNRGDHKGGGQQPTENSSLSHWELPWCGRSFGTS